MVAKPIVARATAGDGLVDLVGRSAPIIAYLFARPDSTPYMEVVPTRDLCEAVIYTEHLLTEHRTAAFAELWQDEDCLFVPRAGAPAAELTFTALEGTFEV